MVIHSNETVLVAVTSIKSLRMISEYAIRLATTIRKRGLLFILMVHEDKASVPNRAFELRTLLGIQRIGEMTGIDVQFKVVQGVFPKQVTEYLCRLNCPLLVVGEGNDKTRRLKELKEIEAILDAKKDWHHRNTHHFLMVSKRHKDPVIFIFNQNDRHEGGKNGSDKHL